MTDILPPTTTGFRAFPLIPAIAMALDGMKITEPTPIQKDAIPAALEGTDIVGIAQTGTGKTLAFGIPLLQHLSQKPGRALILLPTRELAEQVDAALRPIAQAVGIVTAVFIGGASMHMQRMSLKRNPRILIATPGRLLDHLSQRTVTLKEVTMLVLDEADRMLDMGFAPQIQKILAVVPTDRQTMLFSATMPHSIMNLATHHMRLPIRIEVAPQGTAATLVEQVMLIVPRDQKPAVLEKLLRDFTGTVLVFVRTKHGAKKLTKTLQMTGHRAAEIHADRSLGQRRAALAGFKSGAFRVLIATDIAARGIDVEEIELVVNFDLPDNPEDYVHRIGRTGRAGKSGQAISLATPDQRGDIASIERLIRTKIDVTDTTGGRVERAQPRQQHRGGGQRMSNHRHTSSPSRGGPHRRTYRGR